MLENSWPERCIIRKKSVEMCQLPSVFWTIVGQNSEAFKTLWLDSSKNCKIWKGILTWICFSNSFTLSHHVLHHFMAYFLNISHMIILRWPIIPVLRMQFQKPFLSMSHSTLSSTLNALVSSRCDGLWLLWIKGSIFRESLGTWWVL